MYVIEYKIEGMSCKHCETRIVNTLEQIEGVEKVVVSQSDSSVKIFGDRQPSLTRLKETLMEAGGYRISETPA